jgi:5-methylthioribose kinase
VLVERDGGEAWVVKQALAKLRVAVDWFSSPARIEREALGLRWLATLAPPDTTTPLIFEDRDTYILAMAAVPQPHDNWKSLLLARALDPDHVAQFGRLLGTIHRNAAANPEIAAIFDDRSFYDSLRLEPYYRYTAGQVPAAAPFITALLDETWATRLTLVHGDYSPKNILVRDGRLILLDHEVIHWGDPAFDLGFALAHLLSKARHLPQHRQQFADATVPLMTGYAMETRDTAFLPELEWFMIQHTLGCMLARAAGRSQLEYLSDEEKASQRDLVLRLIGDLPFTFRDLVDRATEPAA